MRMLEIGPRETPALVGYEAEHDVTYLDAVPRYEPSVKHVWKYPDALPFADGYFDYIYASHILEHIPYAYEEWAFRDLKRVLAPGGQLHIKVPDGQFIGTMLVTQKVGGAFKGFMFGGMIDEFDVHLNVFTVNSLIWRLQRTGLDVYQCERLDYHMNHGMYDLVASELYAIAWKPNIELGEKE